MATSRFTGATHSFAMDFFSHTEPLMDPPGDVNSLSRSLGPESVLTNHSCVILVFFAPSTHVLLDSGGIAYLSYIYKAGSVVPGLRRLDLPA